MPRRIIKISLLVRDYDEAVQYFTEKLDFALLEDTKLSDSKRWVVIAPPGGTGAALLLAKAKSEEQMKFVGNQTGGRVFLFLETTNFDADYAKMKDKGIKFIEEPRDEEYGRVVVFEDLYGNKWDFVSARR